ncbi:ABC transporter ATP-binding protein [Yoonia sediminilitoris]|uniref:ATP-binding cassette subfamily B protein n=1 Tax=Yoonia sediminilitoris TaxID=1286148 RepID=A0A2T6KLT7_9RHOB|nr:ABC transporter ATP-binding protein [Yoonia sediminilitoris]PUB17154.1 ATP-binding cassette subfamily B protein [Yoonia sediminilitoris]RCW97449.1 ATP-binding cassette subfamily B protein [Yoonia sediminilitoris]
MTPERWIDPFERAEGPPPDTLMAFLRWCLGGSLKVTGWAGVVSALAGTLEVLTAIMLGWVIDAALNSSPDGFFTGNIALLLGVSAFFVILRPAILGLSGIMQSVVVGPALNNLILSRLHRHTLGQAVTFFDNDFAGRISQKQMQAARAASELMVDMIHTVAFALASVVGSVILLLTIDLRSAALLTVWVVAYIWLIRFFMPLIRSRSKARAASRAMVTGQVVDTITNIKTVKLFAHDAFEDRSAIDAMTHYWGKAVDYGWLSASFRFWLMALGGLLPILLVGITLYFWSVGTATPGDVVAAGAVSLRLAQMTGWVSFTLMGMYSNVGELEDAMHTLSPSHELIDAQEAVEMSAEKGEIALKDVSFSYGGGPGGLDHVTLSVGSGEKLGLVGASGAGKSTLVALLLRLYDAEEGDVLIDGQNVRDVTQESLRRNVAMVTQETAMFNRSAFDNIRYGKPDASMEEVEAAARQAEAHEFIVTLKDHKGRVGYDAHLGERGVKLSGGQRQRIAIARAILKDAPILVLDEATSALDSEVEASIQAALESVMEGKTVIAIAHRLSTLARMDRIVVLDAGRVVEEGTHAELLAKDGLYARYWNRQSGGFINVKDAAE